MQKTILFRGLMALAALSFTLMGHAQVQQKPARKTATVRSSTMDISGNQQFLNIDEDSSVNPPQTYIHYKSDALYNITLSGGKVTSMYVNGRQVPADSFYVYDDLIRRLKEQIERDKAQTARDREQAVRDKLQAERDMQQAMKDKQQAERDAAQAVRDKTQAEKDMQQGMRDKQQAERDARRAAQDKVQAERDREQAARDKEQAERDKEQATRDKEQAARDKVQAEEDKALVKSLMAEVVKEGLASDEKSITSLILDDSVFYVNGKRQSDGLQKKFKEKFIKKQGYSVHYHNGNRSVGRIDD